MTDRYIEIRKSQPFDIKEIVELFYDTVHTVNAKDYTEKQLAVWAKKEIDLAAWNKSLLAHHSYVAEIGKCIVGFGDIDDTGYLDRLFVHKDYQRLKIGTFLCDRLERVLETDTIIVHASITAKPFFEKRGYKIIRQQEIERQGILLINYIMQKNL